MGFFSPVSVWVGDFFVGALVPGLLLVVLYLIYVMVVGMKSGKSEDVATNIDAPAAEPASEESEQSLFSALVPPLLLIIVVLRPILGAIVLPTAAVVVGDSGNLLLEAIKLQ